MKSLVFAAFAIAVTIGPAAAQTATSSSNSASSSSAVAAAQAGASAGAGAIGNSVSSTFKQRNQAPGVGLAGTAVGGQSCRATASIGGSGPLFGIGAAFPVDDAECDRRLWASYLSASRDPRAKALAWAIASRSRYVQQGMADLGWNGGDVVVTSGGPVVRAVPGRPGLTCSRWRDNVYGGLCLY